MKKQSAYFILWNSSKNNFNNIYRIIEKNTIVKRKEIVEINNYFDLVCDLYDFENQKELGVYKANKMCNDLKYEIMIIEVEFISDKKYDYLLIQELKKDIRDLYKQKTKNYFHDNIIHGTDSIEEYEYIKKIINNISSYQ